MSSENTARKVRMKDYIRKYADRNITDARSGYNSPPAAAAFAGFKNRPNCEACRLPSIYLKNGGSVEFH